MTDNSMQNAAPSPRIGAVLLWGMAAGVLCLGLFGALAAGVVHDGTKSFDDAITKAVRSNVNPALTRAAILVTMLGSAYVEIIVLALSAGLLWRRQRRKLEPGVLAVSLAGAWILNQLLKQLFHRSRPDIEHLTAAGGYSFPSGHAMVSLAFYGMLGYLVWTAARRSAPASVAALSLALLPILIGLSRIYLGVHFPSDVAAGFCAGVVWLIICVTFLHLWKKNHPPRDEMHSQQ